MSIPKGLKAYEVNTLDLIAGYNLYEKVNVLETIERIEKELKQESKTKGGENT